MKKIAFIVWDYTVTGGIERVLTNLANELCDYYDVHIISLTKSGDRVPYKIDERVNRVYFATDEPLRGREVIKKGGKGVRRYIKDNGIDTVLLMGFQSSMPAIAMLKFRSRTRLIFCEHEALMSRWHEKKITLVRFISALFSKKTVTLTKATAEAYRKKFHLSEKKVTNIYNGINKTIEQNAAAYNPDEKTILSLGRISPEKRYDILTEIAARVLPTRPDWKWIIYGDGEGKAEYDGAVRQRGLENRVFFMGNTDTPETVYRQGGIYALTSEREGFSLVILEAKVNHLPCISFDITSGPGEMIRDGIDGFLIQAMSIEDYAEKLGNLMDDRDLRIKMSKASGENLSEFSGGVIIKKWRALIDGLM